MKGLIIGGIIGSIVLALVLSVFFTYVSYYNRAVTLRESYLAMEKTVQTAHDNMWKQIKQKYEVTDDYKDGFIKTINAIASGRTGGSLIKVVHENMAQGLPDNLYKEVLATIEGKRDMLKRTMDQEVDVAREYNTLVTSFWGRLFVGGPRIDAKLITSGKTGEAWSTGEDNDTSLKGK